VRTAYAVNPTELEASGATRRGWQLPDGVDRILGAAPIAAPPHAAPAGLGRWRKALRGEVRPDGAEQPRRGPAAGSCRVVALCVTILPGSIGSLTRPWRPLRRRI